MEELHGVPESPGVSSNAQGEDGAGNFAALLRAATEALEWAERLLSEEEDRTSPIVSQMPEMEALRAEIEKAAEGAVCRICLSEEWVCENHPHQPWREGGCLCGAGAPCPLCNHLATPATAAPPTAALGPSTPGNSGTPSNTSTHTGDQPL